MTIKNRHSLPYVAVTAVVFFSLWHAAWAVETTQEQLDFSKQSIAMIYNDQFPVGSGIIVGIGENRIYIATASHVTENIEAANLKIEFFKYPGEKFTAQKLFTENSLDMCILLLTALDDKGIEFDPKYLEILPDTSAVSTNSDLYPIGCPQGKTWTTPALNEPDHLIREDGDTFRFQTKIAETGFSGGGVFAFLPGYQNLVLHGMSTEQSMPEVKGLSIDRIMSYCREKHIPVTLTQAPQVPQGNHFSISVAGMEYTRENYTINLGCQAFDSVLRFQCIMKNNSRTTQPLSIVPSASNYKANFQDGSAQIGRASCRKECRSRWSPYH